MQTDLANHIQETPLCDTHEHLWPEQKYVADGPDIIQALFTSYVCNDLVVAGVSQTAVDTFLDSANPDIRGRFSIIQEAWSAIRHTGYGEATRITARELYGIPEITPDALEAAQPIHKCLRQSGQRLSILRDKANLDHVQIDSMTWPCLPDESGPDFFFSDISWFSFCNGTPKLDLLALETDVEVHDLADLRQAMAALFARYADTAVAVKTQHAYQRTLMWQERTDQEAAQSLAAYLRDGEDVSQADSLCLGDWCWARGVELAIEHDLPFKIHTGYYAHHSYMVVDYIRSGHLDALLRRYPEARFVLMHIAYPYSHELIALAKHFPNVYADLCWAWSLDPFSTADFVRRCIHAVPANKIFVFGGDTFWPEGVVGYAYQARSWLTRTLQAEVDDGLITEAEAIILASRYMYQNQYACFRIKKKRETIAAKMF